MEQQPPSTESSTVPSSELFGGTAVATAPVGVTEPGSVGVTFERQATYNRFYAVPLLGIFVKYIMLIPHFVILYALGIVAGVLNLVTWIPVISSGTYPDWGRQMIGGYLRWGARVFAYLLGLTDKYPPFSFGEGDDYPVQVTFNVPPTSNKFWAIPLLGYVAKAIFLIPAAICLMVLGLIVYVMQLFLWIPVLFTGQYPEFGYTFVGGTLRWAMRTYAFFYGLSDTYPAFSLS